MVAVQHTRWVCCFNKWHVFFSPVQRHTPGVTLRVRRGLYQPVCMVRPSFKRFFPNGLEIAAVRLVEDAVDVLSVAPAVASFPVVFPVVANGVAHLLYTMFGGVLEGVPH